MTTPARATWLEDRRKGIGASDVAAILGLSPFASEWDVWASKMGLVPDDDLDDKPHIVRGNLVEPALAEWYAEDTGAGVAGDGETVVVGEYPWLRCSPDRWVANNDVTWLLEIKTSKIADGWGPTGSEATGLGALDIIPAYIAPQCWWQMEVTDTDRVDVIVALVPWYVDGLIMQLREQGVDDEKIGRIVLGLEGVEIRTYTIHRDRTLGAALVAKIGAWWERHVVNGEQPPLSASAASWLVEQHPKAGSEVRGADADEEAVGRAWIDAKAKAKEWAATVKRLDVALKEIIGDDLGIRGDFGQSNRIDWRQWGKGRRLVERVEGEG